jgi:hypothetical protein
MSERNGDAYDALCLIDGKLDANNDLLRELLREALWAHTMRCLPGDGLLTDDTWGTPNITDAIEKVGDGLYAIAAAIRGDARSVVDHYHHRAPHKPEPEGDAGPQITKVDKRRRAS